MTHKRIKEVADFFFSSNDSNKVPLRLSVSLGQFCGEDLNHEQCRCLLEILSFSKDLKRDLGAFRKGME